MKTSKEQIKQLENKEQYFKFKHNIHDDTNNALSKYSHANAEIFQNRENNRTQICCLWEMCSSIKISIQVKV